MAIGETVRRGWQWHRRDCLGHSRKNCNSQERRRRHQQRNGNLNYRVMVLTQRNEGRIFKLQHYDSLILRTVFLFHSYLKIGRRVGRRGRANGGGFWTAAAEAHKQMQPSDENDQRFYAQTHADHLLSTHNFQSACPTVSRILSSLALEMILSL